MILQTLTVGPFGTNCYLVFREKSGELFIVDPADEGKKIVAAAKKHPFRSARILLTHAHVDHISAAGEVASALGIPAAELDPDDREMYRSPANAIPPYFPAATDLPPVKDFAPAEGLTVLKLPGHTRGGSGFLFEEGEEKFLLSGDTLFCASVGRTDLYGGNYGELITSIREKLLTLPDDLEFYPGHGEPSTIGFEKRNNPYLNQE